MNFPNKKIDRDVKEKLTIFTLGKILKIDFCTILKYSHSRKFFELAPGANAQTFWGEQMLMSIVHIDPNSVVPNHSHPHEQAGMLLEGSLDMKIGNEFVSVQ